MSEFLIQADCLYTVDALREHLRGIANVDRLLLKYTPRRINKGVYLGKHILQALDRAADDDQIKETRPVIKKISVRQRKGTAPEIPLEKIL